MSKVRQYRLRGSTMWTDAHDGIDFDNLPARYERRVLHSRMSMRAVVTGFGAAAVLWLLIALAAVAALP